MSKIHLTTGQLYSMVGESEFEVDREYGENRRWSRNVCCILKIDNKFYRVNWKQGLTESQLDEYPEQDAVEVKSVERQITVKDWVTVEEGGNENG